MIECKEIVLKIGRLQYLLSYTEDYPEDTHEKIFALEYECQGIYEDHIKSKGLLLCEDCGHEYHPSTSVSKRICLSCMDGFEMDSPIREERRWKD